MRRRRREGKGSQPYLKVLISLAGLLMIGLTGYCSIPFWLSAMLYLGGLVLFFSEGFLLLWLNGYVEPASCADTTASFAGVYLGEVHLNGYCLAAYECEASGGRKQFRLLCSPPMGPVTEAALVRYMVREGLIAELWPKLSEPIEDETSWAFFA
jgi:hypothetical protein